MKKLLLLSLSASMLLAFTFPNEGQKTGKELFIANCAACHARTMQAVGPSLQRIREDYDTTWVVKFVHSSKQMIADNDTQALFVHLLYGRTEMPAFPELSATDVSQILDYVDSFPFNNQVVQHRKLSTEQEADYIKRIKEHSLPYIDIEYLRDSLAGKQ